MKIDYEYFKGILFVRIKGNLMNNNSCKFSDYLIGTIQKQGIRYLVYNLYDLKNIDETGIKSLELGAKAVADNNGMAYICEVPNHLENKLVNIDKVINELQAVELLNI